MRVTRMREITPVNNPSPLATTNAIDTSTTGVKLRYTAPTNYAVAGSQVTQAKSATGAKFAKVVAMSWQNVAGTPTVTLEKVLQDGSTIEILGVGSADPVGDYSSQGIILQPGESIQFDVTVAAAAASTANAMFSVDEYSPK